MRQTLGFIAGVLLTCLVFFGLTQEERAPETLVASVGAASSTEPSKEVSATAETYKVVKVVDGDTLTLSMNGENVTVRLIGLDTPETVDPRTGVQCFGKEASNKAKEMLTGASVLIETDASQDTYDKYARLLAYVYLSDGVLFNKFMIAEGYGHEYTYNEPYKYQAAFKAAEASARETNKGFWAPDACAEENADVPATKFTPTQGYECSRNAYNCTSFKTQAEAQYVFTLCGASSSDVHKLDSDKDGSVCESLP